MDALRFLGPALCAAAAFFCATAPASAGFTDPTGDTFGTGPVQIDITSYDATFSGGKTTFTVGFASNITAASAFASNSLYGFIDLDLDHNGSTGGHAAFPGATTDIAGGNNWINYYIAGGAAPGPTIATGDEAFIDLGSEANHAGMVDVISASTNAILATVAINYSNAGIALTIPIIGTASDQAIAFDVLVGTSSELTDRASNGAMPDLSHSLSVPEPSSLTLLGLGILACGLARARRPARTRA